MLRSTHPARGRAHFRPVREHYALYSLRADSMFPLLRKNNLYSAVIRHFQDYQGRRPADSDHQLPSVPSRPVFNSAHHRWTNWDKYLNPQTITGPASLTANEEYLGARTGVLLPMAGWMKIGGSWRFALPGWWSNRNSWQWENEWLERNITPRWKLVPRISDFNPQLRYPGKLEYFELPLSKLLWAIDTGALNRNEVITLWHLHEAEVIQPKDVVWPGVKLVDDGVTPRYPLSIELQNGAPDVIRKIEAAGGSFVSAYLSLDGLYQTMHPEEYPVFQDQHLPDRPGMQQVAMSDQARGYLCRYYESELKYAHPEAGRRLSHYVRPPTDRDFPATYEEYERVKHHQKWHLGQSGTGTVLPFVHAKSIEDLPLPPTELNS